MKAISIRAAVLALLLTLLASRSAPADGIMLAKQGVLDAHAVSEKSQEAIIIFHDSKTAKKAIEDLILRVRVKGSVDEFAWVIPLPNEPKIAKADGKLFDELFEYVKQRKLDELKGAKKKFGGMGMGGGMGGVDVLSRQVVGSYDTAVVKENEPGKLNEWLKREGYRSLVGGERLIAAYREKGCVFACVKVSETELAKRGKVDLHPLHFRFETGGRDGIYYPMRITGLQKDTFDINLYVFYRFWLNGDLNRYGYKHRGISLHYRDWDGPRCTANAGKAWSRPTRDPFLRGLGDKITNVSDFFQKHYPRSRFYLTNLRARDLDPKQVREWPDDLWFFPYYLNRRQVPYDARRGAPASDAYQRSR